MDKAKVQSAEPVVVRLGASSSGPSSAVSDNLSTIEPAGPAVPAQASQGMESVEFEDPNAGQPEIQPPTGFKFWLLFGSLALALVVLGFDLSVVSVAVPAITDEFKNITYVGWYSAASRLTLCAFQFMFSKMCSIYNIKYVFLASLGIFELGALLCGAATSANMLVFGRAVLGVGGAGLISGSFAVFTKTVPLAKRSIYGAALGACEVSAISIGPILGGVLVESLSWRWCFYINLPLGAITFLIAVFFFADTGRGPYADLSWKEKLGKLDLVSTAVFVPAVTAVMMALQWGGVTYGWTSWRIIMLFVVFAVLIMIFAYLQYRRGDEAILPPRIIGNRSIISGMWFSACLNAGSGVITYYLPIYLQAVRGFSPSRSGLLLLPNAIGMVLGAFISGRGINMIGYYVPFMLAASIFTPLPAGLLTTIKVHENTAVLLVYQALLGLFFGIGIQGPQVAAQTVLKSVDATMGLSVIIFAQNFGPTIFIAAGQTIFTNRITDTLHTYLPGSNATYIEDIGLSDLRLDLNGSVLADSLLSYDKAITETFYLGVALVCVSLVGCVFIEWRSVKGKKQQ